MATSSDSDSDKAAEFKRVDKKKRKPSPEPAPSSKKTRTLRKKQQVVREPSSPKKKKVTHKKLEQKVSDTLSLVELINEITQDGNLGNVSKFYHSFKDIDKDTIEESMFLYLDIYKKVLIEVIDVFPNDLYLRLEAKRMSNMELDKKLKVEALLVVHPVKFKQEIDDLIYEANRTIFASGHQQVSLMADILKKQQMKQQINGAYSLLKKRKEKKMKHGKLINPSLRYIRKQIRVRVRLAVFLISQ